MMRPPQKLTFGRRLIGLSLAAGALLLAGCAVGPRASDYTLQPGAPVAAAAGEGLVVLAARRLTRDGCNDFFEPSLIIAAPPGSEHAWRVFAIPTPFHAGWLPDPARPGALRRAYLLRLPAGTHVVAGWSYYNSASRTSVRAETGPWRFDVVAGRATYVGGLGIAPSFFEFLGCRANDGQVFHFSDPANDIALARQLWPELSRMEIVDRSARPAGWRRGPVGFD